MSQIRWPLLRNEIRRNKKSNTYGEFKERAKGVHWGWDFYAAVGTPCYAIADGIIVDFYGGSTDTTNFGLVVVLEFEFEEKNLYAAYCHLSDKVGSIEEGDAVKKGQLIAFTGNSGNAFRMSKKDEHLHFEIRTSAKLGRGGYPLRLDPMLVFKHCPLNAAVIQA